MKRTTTKILAYMALVGLAGAPIKSNALTNPNGPLYVATSIAPLVMLDITKDQNLYKKLFNDATDLDGDSVLDTTYKHSIDYYGYFDSYKCYTYSTTNGYFSPLAGSYSEDSNGNPVKPSTCSGNWHGNFLNWASMTRMDAVRKLLYGGYRSTDGTGASGTTILERSYITTDAHSFAKYYNPDIASVLDPVVMGTFPVVISGTSYATASAYTSANYPALGNLTPYSPTTTPTSIVSTSSATLATGIKTFTVPDTTKFSYGDQLLITNTGTAGGYMIGAVSCVNGTGISMYDSLFGTASSCSSGQIKVVVELASSTAGNSYSTWGIQDWTQTGLTMCNTTTGSSTGANAKSQTNTNPPLLRVANGNFSMWAANERWQCTWREESANLSPSENTGSLSGATSTQGNRAAVSGLYASSLGPNKTTTSSGRIANGVAGSSSDLIVRVQACVTGAVGQEDCELYPSGDYKPVGLLQTYGEAGLLKFGLMTGSYTDNESGGVLRKNMGSMSNEINTTTDGTFIPSPSGGAIVTTLNKMRIYGYNYGDGTYDVDATNGSTFCSWGQTTFSQGQCLSWGNPMSEVYLESLRYLGGQSATTAFNADDSSLISGLTTATWSDPINSNNYCAPLNVLVFNASTSSYDAHVGSTDQMTGITDIGSTNTATVLTDYVGTFDGINGNSWFVGNTPTSPTGTNANICSVKSVSNLSTVFGICPEGPATQGGYLMAGAALYAHTNRIRTGSALSALGVPATDTSSLLVNSYGIALASSVPQINVSIASGSTTKTVILQPATLNNLSGGNASGTLVDFEKVCEIPIGASAANIAAVTQKSAGTCAAAGSAAFYVNWEDSAQGGDYDQDMWGRLRYQIGTGKLTVTTDVIAQSTPDLMGFGYSIQGTTQDGPHFHSGINSFYFTDSANITVTGSTSDIAANGGCNGCVVGDPATSATYTVATTTTNASLHDPLWYLAKWGGFTGASTALGGSSQSTNPITSVNQWDVKNVDGSTTGCTSAGCDGIPDNYFPVTNPNALQTALDQAFAAMLSSSSASSVATNSTSLQTGSQIFQASFNTNNWSGVLSAFNLTISTDPTKNGLVITPAAWADGGENAGGVADAFDGQTSSTRNIITYSLDSQGGIPFEWSNISGQTNTAQATYLNKNQSGTVDNKGAQRLAYLRGDRTNEGTKSTNFRERFSMLGDIIDSSPTYVGAPGSGWAGSSYLTFLTNNLSRTPMVYVGGNDGMLHGFAAADGTEKIAYVPNEVYANLSQYPAQGYSHRYYVDGTPMVNDIQVGSGSSQTWKTYLVGGLNWGGRAYYALDITDPTQFTESTAASVVKWEFSHTIDGDLGYTFMQPTYFPFTGNSNQLTLMHNGRWALITGNGYNSDNGKSALFIIFLDHSGTTWTAGTDYIKLVADGTGPSNGMSTPATYDFDGDGVTDYIYAGDLQGNLWKFDVTNADPSKWAVAFSGSPLFVAKDSSGNRQPITTAPSVTLALDAPGEVGAMIDFGTGQYLQASDVTSPYATQTLYGIWDSTATATVSGRSVLQQQTVVSTSSAITNNQGQSNVFRQISSNAIDWTKQFGWYIDLPSSNTTGERVAYNPVLNDGTFLVVTLIPSTTPCLAGGSSWVMALNAYTGTAPSTPTFDINGDGKFDNANDEVTTAGTTYIPGGASNTGSGILTSVTLVKDQYNANETHGYASSSNGSHIEILLNGPLHSSGRIDWREINQ